MRALSGKEMEDVRRLFKAGYLPRKLQELVYGKNPEWTAIGEQTALPILSRMEVEKEKAKTKKAKTKKSKAKKRKGGLL